MGAYRLPRLVEARIIALLDEGAQMFGEAARDRYAALILRAMQDVAEDPGRPGSRTDPAIDPTARYYHLRHSRDRVGMPPGRVRTPRHVLVYDLAADGVVDILGLVPDRIPLDIAMPRFVPDR